MTGRRLMVMFRITYDPSSGSDEIYLIEIIYNGSIVLIMCVVGDWRHIISTIGPLYVISIKYSSSLPDDGSYVIRNKLEYFNVCLLDFCIMQILTPTIVIIESISWLIKVTDNNYARWKTEIKKCLISEARRYHSFFSFL